MRISARIFGTTRKRMGLSAMVRMASISSEITMVPISAAMAEPLRPDTITAVSSGERVSPDHLEGVAARPRGRLLEDRGIHLGERAAGGVAQVGEAHLEP